MVQSVSLAIGGRRIVRGDVLYIFLCPTWQVSGELCDKDDNDDRDRQHTYVAKLNKGTVWMLQTLSAITHNLDSQRTT